MTLLPWLLIIVLDGYMDVPTPMRYATYEDCMTKGGLLALSMKVDLQLTNRVLDPKCVKQP